MKAKAKADMDSRQGFGNMDPNFGAKPEEEDDDEQTQRWKDIHKPIFPPGITDTYLAKCDFELTKHPFYKVLKPLGKPLPKVEEPVVESEEADTDNDKKGKKGKNKGKKQASHNKHNTRTTSAGRAAPGGPDRSRVTLARVAALLRTQVPNHQRAG